MSRLARWVICEEDARGPVVRDHCTAWRERHELPDGRVLVQAYFDEEDQVARADADPRCVLSSLNAAADRMAQRKRDAFSAQGVRLVGGETYFDLLTALKQQLGWKFRIEAER